MTVKNQELYDRRPDGREHRRIEQITAHDKEQQVAEQHRQITHVGSQGTSGVSGFGRNITKVCSFRLIQPIYRSFSGR